MPNVSNDNKKIKSIFSKIYFKKCLAIFTPLIGVWLGAYLQYHYSFLIQNEIANSQKRQQVYSQLMGIKIVRAQLYFSRFEALIYSDYYERRYQLLGSTEDFKECNRWMHRSEDLVVELSRNNKELFETIGFINVLFTPTDKLDELVQNIYKFKNPDLKVKPFNLGLNQLEKWKIIGTTQLNDVIENSSNKPIDELLAYLANEIKTKKK